MNQLLSDILSYSFILSVPLTIVTLILAFKLVSTVLRLFSLAVCLVMIIISWSFLVEPNIIIIKEINIPMGINRNIVLVSDTHFSKIKNVNFATSIANKINSLSNIDMVLWAGDWNESLTISEIAKPLSLISTIKFPQYSVFGNHDFDVKLSAKSKTINQQTDYNLKLQELLAMNRIKTIENETVSIGDIELIGLSSESTTYQSLQLSDNDTKKIYLSHEPSNINILPENKNQLLLAGHSHCGQIKLPYITEWGYNNFGSHKSKYFEGLYEVDKKGKMFISCGLGETVLPLRLFNPPTIYKINLN